jgi:serine/threonine protein kinase
MTLTDAMFFVLDNVVLLMGICEEPLSVVTEFLARGSLYSYIRQNTEMPLDLQKKIITGIARGMFHLHLENIVHRDLATRNVLLTESLEPKISDFVSDVKR